MVECADGKLYIGVTNDVARRISEHNLGTHKSAYTYKRRPVHLVYTVEFNDVYDAISWEKHIKRWSNNKKKALIRGDETALKLQALCKNQSHSKFRLRDLRIRTMCRAINLSISRLRSK